MGEMYLRLRSRVKSIYDHRNIDVSEFVPEWTHDEARLQRDMGRILKMHGEIVVPDAVAEGDSVTLSCVSQNQRFNKQNIVVIVGRGLFSRELECGLIGMSIGDNATLHVEGTEISIYVKDIRRTVLPELCDDVAAAWGMEGVSSVEDLKRFCIAKQIDKLLDECEEADMASALVCQGVTDKSEFDLCDEEVKYVIGSVKKRLPSAEEMADDNDDAYGFESAEDMERLMEKIYLDGFKTAVIGFHILNERNELLTDEDYAAAIQNLMAYDEGMTCEQAEVEYPTIEFMISRYSDVYAKSVDRYVADEFKRILMCK